MSEEKMIQMASIKTDGPAGKRSFTIIQPPFPQVGEWINGIGIVKSVKLTMGCLLARPGRAQESHAKKSKSTEAKRKTTSHKAKP